MADGPYQGMTGLEVELAIGRDISGASNVSIQVRKPLGSVVEWPAEKAADEHGVTSLVRCVTPSDALDEPGTYSLQAHMTIGDCTAPSKTVKLVVLPRFS